MRTPFATLIAVAGAYIAGAGIACADNFNSVEGNFTAAFPAPPLIYRFQGQTTKGTRYDETRWSALNKDGYWGVVMLVYAKPRKADYDFSIRSAIASMHGRLVSQKPVRQGSVGGREIVVEASNSGFVRERILWVGDHLYLVVFSGSKATMTAPKVDKFLSSFAVTAPLEAGVPAQGADIDHWSQCMARSGPSAAIKECTAIIDAKKELPDSLPYAYLYRGDAHLRLKEGDLAFKDFTAALKIEPQLAHAHYGLGA
jgi:hypothetical protein